jgi:hypothetical protein
MVRTCGTRGEHSCRMLKMAVQQGRSERRAEAYPLGYVEGLNDARTLLADFFSSLLEGRYSTCRSWSWSMSRWSLVTAWRRWSAVTR